MSGRKIRDEVRVHTSRGLQWGRIVGVSYGHDLIDVRLDAGGVLLALPPECVADAVEVGEHLK